MTPAPIPGRPVAKSNIERMFPTFTERQIARIADLGLKRATQPGEVLYDPGELNTPLFVIVSGQVDIIRRTAGSGDLVTTCSSGQFTGEVNILTGRRSLVRAVVSAAGEVIELSRERTLALVQTDADISEILMRAFIVRRAELITAGLGETIVVGSSHCAGTLRVKEFLTRNIHPFSYIDLDRDADVQTLLDRFNIAPGDIPVLICRSETVLRNPDNRAIAECLGFNVALDEAKLHDVIVVGAGPAGLAAAVYAASEGLDVVVLETNAPGGQAGSSSKIENYLGFPTGISGQALAARAFTQAEKFGAHVQIAESACRLDCSSRPYRIEIAGRAPLRARTVVIATGATYRKPPIDNLPAFEGVGVYYGATFMEAQLCVDEEVIVIGGGNSAGQAAVYLSQMAKRVHVLVRSSGLADTMSRYLIRRIEDSASIELHTRTELIALDGSSHLERVRWRDNRSGETVARDIRHVFIMAGAVPATGWLDGCLQLDSKQFIKTGPDLSADDLNAAAWPMQRPPYLLETSLPGVLAVGDVRAANIKRVAAAVGEGSIAVSFVHRILQE